MDADKTVLFLLTNFCCTKLKIKNKIRITKIFNTMFLSKKWVYFFNITYHFPIII